MQYAVGIFAGIAASAAFWLLDNWLLTLPQSYQVGGAVACFLIFGGVGYWLASRTLKQPERAAGTRLASGLKGRSIKATVEDVTATGGPAVDILSDVVATGDIEATAKKIKTKS